MAARRGGRRATRPQIDSHTSPPEFGLVPYFSRAVSSFYGCFCPRAPPRKFGYQSTQTSVSLSGRGGAPSRCRGGGGKGGRKLCHPTRRTRAADIGGKKCADAEIGLVPDWRGPNVRDSLVQRLPLRQGELAKGHGKGKGNGNWKEGGDVR